MTSTIAKDAELLESIDTSSTMDLHRSNLLRLQINEILEECQLDLQSRKWAASAQEYLQYVSKIVSKMSIDGIESYQDRSDKPISIRAAKNCLKIQPIGFSKTPVGWTKKSGNAQVLPTFTLMILLPVSLFSAKDYLNYRYFDKRNFIMDNIAQKLIGHSKKLGNIEYVWCRGSNRSPYIQLVPAPKPKATKFQVHLHIGMESNQWIPKLRLVPNRCNIKDISKSQWYNNCLLFDCRHEFEDSYLQELAEHSNVEATLVLVQIWALQRGLWRNHDGWSKENVALLLVYLLRTHKMNARMTPIQLLTVVLQTWATTNWLGEDPGDKTPDSKMRVAHSQATQFQGTDSNTRRTVFVLPSDELSERETIRQSELAQLYEQKTRESPLTDNDPPTLLDAYAQVDSYKMGPVFLDPTMSYNYLGGVSPNYMRVLQSHAQKSLQALKKSRSAFGYLFMTPTRFWDQWDMYIKIPMGAKESVEWEFSVRNLVQVLELGLGNRIHGMRVLSTGNGEVSSGQKNPDHFPIESVEKGISYKRHLAQSPTGDKDLVLGISINPETSQRVVDRGPPSDHTEDVESFKKLWGPKAQLRRFKDGAIVQAVVWNDDNSDDSFQNEVKLKGGYVEKIIRHLVRLHHTKKVVQVSHPHLVSVIDGVISEDKKMMPFVDPVSSHQNIMKAFESLSDFLRKNTRQPLPGSLETSRLGLPLSIDAVEPLSPCLRYSELLPPIPHQSLGGYVVKSKDVSGAIVSDPILIQIRFGSSSKWPSDLKAIGAAKTAMLIQLANGIETCGEKGFVGPITVTPSYADIGYQGYCFRVLVRADPEITILQGLVKPSAVATRLLRELTKKHIIASKHHATIHAVHTLHPSAAAVVRLAMRWVSSHLLSGLISQEAIELLVAKVYSDGEALLAAPGTVMAGFMSLLRLLSNHDWEKEPLVVNPRDHISDDEYDEINHQFEELRGENMDSGPPMYIIAPYDRGDIEDDDPNSQNAVKTNQESSWQPSVSSPEWVVLKRAVALAKRSYDFMHKFLVNFDESEWSGVFQETPGAFKSYSVLLRVDSDFVFDSNSSSTSGFLDLSQGSDGELESAYSRSMRARFRGPKALRRKLYKNLGTGGGNSLLKDWNPVRAVVNSLREKFGPYALFFYNDLAPEVIGVVWRPKTFDSMPFSVMNLPSARPIQDGDWKSDSLIIRNATDLLREISQFYEDVVTTVKIFDESVLHHRQAKRSRKD